MAKDSVNISIPYFFNRKGLNENISLEELEKFSEPIIDKAISSVWKALDNAGITKEELDLVILAGGLRSFLAFMRKYLKILELNHALFQKI